MAIRKLKITYIFCITSILSWRYLLLPLWEVDTQQHQLKQGVLFSGSLCNCSETSEPKLQCEYCSGLLGLGGIPGSPVAQRPLAAGLEVIFSLCGSSTPVHAYSLTFHDQWAASLQLLCSYCWEKGNHTGLANVSFLHQLSWSVPTACS